MLDDLDNTLKELLRRGLSPPYEQVEISFVTPDQSLTSKVSLPAIDLFLYDIRENLELRKTEPLVERNSSGIATQHRPPVRIDCSYLITVWLAEPGDPQVEHRLLGEVMQVLLRHPKIPAAVLQGSLRQQDPPPRSLALRPAQLQSLGEFWQAMGGRPKPTLSYIVTLAVPVHTETDTVPLVLDYQVNPS